MSKKEISVNIDIKKEPKSELPIIEPKKTYTEMLGKGYARIGDVNSKVKSNFYSENLAKKDLIKVAKKNGAEIIWINIDIINGMKQTTVVKESSSKYVTGYGKPYKETTIKYGTGYKNEKTTYGQATLFVYEPELAAKQLIDGKKKWEVEAAICKKTRDELIAKLEKIKKILEQVDPTVFYNKSSCIDDIKNGIDDLNKCDYHSEIYNNVCFIWGATGENKTIYYKDLNDPKREKIYKLALDAKSYIKENLDVLWSLYILNFAEHILF